MTHKQSRPGTATQPARDAFDSRTILTGADSWWRECAERAMTWYINSGLSFTADDLVDLGVPEPDLSGRWGALFSRFHRRGLIELVDYQPSRRPSRQGDITRVWRGVA